MGVFIQSLRTCLSVPSTFCSLNRFRLSSTMEEIANNYHMNLIQDFYPLIGGSFKGKCSLMLWLRTWPDIWATATKLAYMAAFDPL